MDETLRQIGELLLGAVPTIIFFLFLYGLYTLLVHKPLARVLAERRARTQGAIEKARADVAAAAAQARANAQAQIEQARVAIEQDKAAAKQNLEGEAGRLATEIIRTVLEPAMSQAPVGGR